MVAEDDETSKDKEIDKLMALISLSFKKIYKPTNNNLRTSSNTSRANQDNSPRINRSAGYENQRIGNVAGARETVGSSVVQKSEIQCYNYKEFGHVARECQKPKRAKDAAYHREKMLLCKQEEAGIQLNAEQADWRDDTDDDELEDQELEAHYIYMAQLQEVSTDAADSGPIFDDEPLQKNDDDNDLAKERELLASLIEKLKCEIDESKNRNKFLETSNKVLIEKLKEAQIKLYKTREDKELDKVIELEQKVKVLDNIVYKTGQSVQTMNMLNNKCQTSFTKPEFLKKDQRANPRLYDIGCYNEILALILAPDSNEVIRLEKESRSKLSDLIRPFDYDKLNNLEYYYADHMNAILGVYTELDEVTNLQCDYLELLEKCEGLETELSKSKMMSKSFESVRKHAINLELELQQCKEKIKNDMLFKVIQTKDFCKERGQYFEIQDLKAQLQDKGNVISELKKLIEKLKGKSVDTKFEKSSVIRQPNAFKSQRPSVLGKPTTFSNSFVGKDFSKSNLNAKTLNVNPISAMYDKCVLIDKHDMCVLNSVAKPIKRTVASESNHKPRNITRKLYERVSKTCSWWYPKFTPLGYKWKPKSEKENVNPNVSMPLANTSRTANVMDTMTSRRSTVSNAPLSSNSFAARRDCPIHRRLWVLKVHDEKSQAFN
nr:hypothetical protein [Tanacetum cinerariifolium]